MKKCTKCGVEKEATTEYFLKYKTSKDGLRAACKTCMDLYYQENKEYIAEQKKQYRQENKEYIADYYQENKERIAEQKKQYYQENKERIAERSKRHRQENKERIAERAKRYYQENKEYSADRSKRYQQENPEKCAIYSQRRRAWKIRLDSTLTFEQWETIKVVFNNSCAYCGNDKKIEQEHFIPLSKGGEYTRNNIIPACKSCNSSKQDQDFFKWYPKHKSYSKKREKNILDHLGYNKNIQQLSIL